MFRLAIQLSREVDWYSTHPSNMKIFGFQILRKHCPSCSTTFWSFLSVKRETNRVDKEMVLLVVSHQYHYSEVRKILGVNNDASRECIVLSMFWGMITCFSLPHKMQYASNFEICFKCSQELKMNYKWKFENLYLASDYYRD